MSEAIKEKFSKDKIRFYGIEGVDSARWILMDYGDVIIHIFDDDTRTYYGLEKLWLDAPRIPVEAAPRIRKTKAEIRTND